MSGSFDHRARAGPRSDYCTFARRVQRAESLAHLRADFGSPSALARRAMVFSLSASRASMAGVMCVVCCISRLRLDKLTITSLRVGASGKCTLRQLISLRAARATWDAVARCHLLRALRDSCRGVARPRAPQRQVLRYPPTAQCARSATTTRTIPNSAPHSRFARLFTTRRATGPSLRKAAPPMTNPKELV